MKKQILVLFLFLAFTYSAYCNDTITSKIIFYREYNFQGGGLSYKIFVGDSMVGKLKNSSYFTHSCLSGEYDVQINKLKNTTLHLTIEQGKTYYVRLGIRVGMWSNVPELLLVDSISAYPAIKNRSMRELAKQTTPWVRPKNRFGLNINMGGGFEKFPMVTLADGSESSISFGGGFAFGLKYGYELHKYFDLAIDLNYQYSDLKPVVKNADVTFSRGAISITPSFIIPIGEGDEKRIKFGFGLDNYFGTNLTLDLTELPGGFKDKWIYKNSIGYHVSGIFELNLSDNWSNNYGLKWYNVSYSFEKGDVSYPTDSKLTTPNGSGIDFLCGFYYHF